MSIEIVITAAAEAQADAADAWWRTNRPDATGLFWQEFTEALALLGDAPAVGERYPRGGPAVRRLLLARTRYHVYYVHESERLAVVAVWSARCGSPPPVAG